MRSFQNVIKDKVLDEKITPKTHLAIKRDKDIAFMPYTKGLTTPTETQIISDDIKETDKIIVGIEGQSTTNKSSMPGPRM